MRWSVVVAAMVAAGCLSASPPATDEGSGIYGVAMIGPTCPVMRDPPDPNCADRPFQGEFTVNARDSTVVRTFSSDPAGKFNVTLAPGEYMIRLARSDGGPPTCERVAVVVSAGAWTSVDISCDSGIR